MSHVQKIKEVEASWRLQMINAAMSIFDEYAKKPKLPFGVWLVLEKQKAEAKLSKIRGAVK